MTKKIKKYKVGIDSETYAISMVEEPAIEVDFVALTKEEPKMELFQSDERHICYGAALIPNKDIYRVSEDGTEYYLSFTEESISKMSQEFMREYRQHNVTLDHQDDANEVYIVESWLVEDSYKDKANALGIDVPKGTWMVAMKVNNIETWERVKAGELKGFSVEALISLEDFNKIENNDNMVLEDNEMFWTKLKDTIMSIFKKEQLAEMSGMTVEQYDEEVKAIEAELEIETPTETPTVETPAVDAKADSTDKGVTEEPTVAEEPTVEEPAVTEENDIPTVEEAQPNPYEELLKNLNAEIKALKEMNEGLVQKVNDLGKKPSAEPINTNASNGGNGGSSYESWRAQMAKYI